MKCLFFVLGTAETICGENWHLVGNSCLTITNIKNDYDNAKLYCRGQKAALVSLTSQKKVDFVLKELQIMHMSVSKMLQTDLI